MWYGAYDLYLPFINIDKLLKCQLKNETLNYHFLNVVEQLISCTICLNSKNHTVP